MEPAPASSPAALLRSTAPYRAKHRPGYPTAMIEHLADHFGLDGSQRLLDLGCGTGPIARAISGHAAEVIAVDPEPIMLHQGLLAAEEAGIANITWLVGASTTLEHMQLGQFDLVCIGPAFERMDREATVAVLDQMITPTGGLVIATGARPAETPPWQAAIDRVLTTWPDPEPTPEPDGPADLAEKCEPLLADSAFTDVQTRTWAWTLERNLDAIVGYEFSHPRSTPARFGDQQAKFEAELRAALQEAVPSGDFTQRLHTQTLTATRPR